MRKHEGKAHQIMLQDNIDGINDIDGIVHCHNKRAQTMTHIHFPITLMGSECASSQGTRSKGTYDYFGP